MSDATHAGSRENKHGGGLPDLKNQITELTSGHKIGRLFRRNYHSGGNRCTTYIFNTIKLSHTEPNLLLTNHPKKLCPNVSE